MSFPLGVCVLVEGGLREAVERVRAAARVVTAVTERVRALLASDPALGLDVRFRQRDIHREYERDVAAAGERCARVWGLQRERVIDRASALASRACTDEWSNNTGLAVEVDLLAVADHVRVGTLHMDAAGLGVSEPGAVPVVVPLLDQGHVVVSAGLDQPEVRHVVNNVVARALAGTGPGQVVLRVFDPALRGYASSFAGLREVSEQLFPAVGSHGEDLEAMLSGLVGHVRRVSDLGHGNALSLGALRRDAGVPIESYQLVVLLDYPQGVSERSAELLATLLRTGPHHGVSFIIHENTYRSKPRFTAAVPLDMHAHMVSVRDVDGGTCAWSKIPTCRLELDQPSAGQVRKTVADVVAVAQNAGAPTIPFSEIHPTQQLWTDSSAAGFTVAVGRSGRDVTTLILGDDRYQRHNVLITGAVGQGKSNLLTVFIHSLAARYSPDEIELYLLDLKEGVTFFPLAPNDEAPEWLPHARVIGLESDRPYAVSVLEHLLAEFERRAQVIKPHGDNIATFRQRVPDARMPRIVAIIDEFHVLFEEKDATTERAVQLLERLARRGRACGIHLVLASQTVSGITALMSKESGIYSQFPVRIALRNSASESRAVLDAYNSEAVDLRFRGEAIVNLDFGQREGNRRTVIAMADTAELARLRQRLWHDRDPDAEPPMVFDGGTAATLPVVVESLRQLRAQAYALDAGARTAIVGLPIAVTRRPIGVPLPHEPGRHLAIVGAGHRVPPIGSNQPAPPNLAVGALQAAVLSLALQHPASDAAFTVLSYLTDPESDASGMSHLLELLGHWGFPVSFLRQDDATARLREIATELGDRKLGDNTVTHYVIMIAVDRAGTLDRPSDGFTPPVDNLRTLLRDGPRHGTHIVGWWSSPGVLKAHLSFDPTTTMDAILALRMEKRDITGLMGPTVTWTPTDNRGLLFDRTQLPVPIPIIPIAPLDHATFAALQRVDWDM